MPMIPPARKTAVEKSVARVASTPTGAQAGEQKGNHDGGELEKALDPEVHHPPPPVFRGDQMALLPIHQSGSIEQRNGDTGDQKEYEQRLVLRLTCQCRAEGTDHESQPEDKPDEEYYLPAATEINVLVPLRAEPEPGVAQILLHPEPLAEEGTHDHNEERDEEQIHTRPLPRWFIATDGGGDIQTGCQPRGGNPEQAKLRMPGTSHRIRQPLVQGMP